MNLLNLGNLEVAEPKPMTLRALAQRENYTIYQIKGIVTYNWEKLGIPLYIIGEFEHCRSLIISRIKQQQEIRKAIRALTKKP